MVPMVQNAFRVGCCEGQEKNEVKEAFEEREVAWEQGVQIVKEVKGLRGEASNLQNFCPNSKRKSQIGRQRQIRRGQGLCD